MALFDGYPLQPNVYDEMFQADGQPRPRCRALRRQIDDLSVEEFRRRSLLAERTRRQEGITPPVADDEPGVETPRTFDLIPRLVSAEEWDFLESGLKQRLAALNLFLHDIYHAQKILNDHVVPRELVYSAARYRREFFGATPPGGVYVPLYGADLIRDPDGTYHVLEDHLRAPSGIACLPVNRLAMTQALPDLFRDVTARPLERCAALLLRTLRELAPAGREAEPNVVLLAAGTQEREGCEHACLARQMDIPLAAGRDLFVDGNIVCRMTPDGPQRVDILYRNIDDDLLDPLVFRRDSALGTPGLVNACRAGSITLVNAIGAGAASDKALYAYAPRIIEYYLNEKPILPNVETYLAWNPQHRKHILENLDRLVVKRADGAGAEHALIGPQASQDEREAISRRIQADPRDYIAQPLIAFSCAPTFVEDRCESRHVDMQTYLLYSKRGIAMLPGALTRVASSPGSYIVNAASGCVSKDTWALPTEGGPPK